MDDFERGVATCTRWVFTGEPDNYESTMVKAGDTIPKGAKSRPWLLGRPEKPVKPAEKPAVDSKSIQKRKVAQKKGKK